MTTTRQNNDINDLTGAIYAEMETKLSRPIRLGAVCDENQRRQQYDRSYICGPC